MPIIRFIALVLAICFLLPSSSILSPIPPIFVRYRRRAYQPNPLRKVAQPTPTPSISPRRRTSKTLLNILISMWRYWSFCTRRVVPHHHRPLLRVTIIVGLVFLVWSIPRRGTAIRSLKAPDHVAFADWTCAPAGGEPWCSTSD